MVCMQSVALYGSETCRISAIYETILHSTRRADRETCITCICESGAVMLIKGNKCTFNFFSNIHPNFYNIHENSNYVLSILLKYRYFMNNFKEIFITRKVIQFLKLSLLCITLEYLNMSIKLIS